MTYDELVEKVARAMWEKPLDEHCAPVPWEDATDEARDAYLMEASAAIAVVLEEAAQMIERRHGYGVSLQIAEEIRAMRGSKSAE